MERRFLGLRVLVGRTLGTLGLVCAVVGILVVDGVSIEFPGLMFGGLGYYFGLTAQDRTGRILALVALGLNVVSILYSGLAGIPQ